MFGHAVSPCPADFVDASEQFASLECGRSQPVF